MDIYTGDIYMNLMVNTNQKFTMDTQKNKERGIKT